MKQKWEGTFPYGNKLLYFKKKVKLKSAKNMMVFFFCLFVF